MMWNGVTTKQMEAVMYPIWRPRGYEWVDPAKDVKSDIDAINMGLKTRTDVLGERGQDFETTMKQIAAEKKLIEGLGLEFSSDGKPLVEEPEKDEPVNGKGKSN
jgi:capsid protein